MGSIMPVEFEVVTTLLVAIVFWVSSRPRQAYFNGISTPAMREHDRVARVICAPKYILQHPYSLCALERNSKTGVLIHALNAGIQQSDARIIRAYEDRNLHTDA